MMKNRQRNEDSMMIALAALQANADSPKLPMKERKRRAEGRKIVEDKSWDLLLEDPNSPKAVIKSQIKVVDDKPDDQFVVVGQDSVVDQEEGNFPKIEIQPLSSIYGKGFPGFVNGKSLVYLLMGAGISQSAYMKDPIAYDTENILGRITHLRENIHSYRRGVRNEFVPRTEEEVNVVVDGVINHIHDIAILASDLYQRKKDDLVELCSGVADRFAKRSGVKTWAFAIKPDQLLFEEVAPDELYLVSGGNIDISEYDMGQIFNIPSEKYDIVDEEGMILTDNEGKSVDKNHYFMAPVKSGAETVGYVLLVGDEFFDPSSESVLDFYSRFSSQFESSLDQANKIANKITNSDEMRELEYHIRTVRD